MRHIEPKKQKLGLFFTNVDLDYNKVAASCWIRMLQMVKHYEAQGYEVHINKYFKNYDVSILYRKPKRKYYYILRYLKLISKKSYFDTCINIFNQHEEISAERLHYAKKIGKHADGIICASNYIAHVAQEHAKSVHVMKDPIDLDHFKTLKHNVNFDNPQFGWSGVPQKAHFLNPFAEVIDNRITLITMIHNFDFSELKFRHNLIEWRYENFPTDLLNIDIALLPRSTNDVYNMGHSSFKALVFAALGIPIIANKIPSYLHLSKYFDGIVFLEDFGNSIELCINELKNRDLSPNNTRNFYSCQNQAKDIAKYLSK